MKKNIILIILILMIIAIIGTTIILNNKTKNEIIENNEPEVQETNTQEIVDEKPIYIDENKVQISLYIEQGNNLVKLSEYSCDWSAENVFNVFYAIPSTQESIPNYNFDSMWKENISNYENGEKCRVGYTISFNYEDGKTYTYTVKNPDDAYHTFPKVMTFLYDDVNLVPGKPYYHITQDVMYDYTIASSIKLVGDVDTYKIHGPITLTAFCFDSEDDFDENGNYRGNSSYTITITKE